MMERYCRECKHHKPIARYNFELKDPEKKVQILPHVQQNQKDGGKQGAEASGIF